LARDAAFLESLKPEEFQGVCEAPKLDKFNMGEWVCNTSACAIGFIGCSPAANAEGFSMHLRDGMKYNPETYLYEKTLRGYPVFGYQTDWRAIRDYYDIDQTTAEELFGVTGHLKDTPRDVAKRIYALLTS
jgi:hypothetical protein